MADNKYPNMRQLLNIVETVEDSQKEQIAAVAQLIADRTEDADSESKLSTKAFLMLLNNLGIPMTKETLMDLVEQGKLNSVLKNMNAKEVFFKGQKDIDPSEMNVDKAKDIVSDMAKRSSKKRMKDN